MKKKLKVAIIGCGDIAGGYDEHKNDSGIFSHVGAYRSFPDIEIVNAFDTNARKLNSFCHYWGIKKHSGSLNDLLKDKYDILSVCTPDHTHEFIIERIINSGSCRYIWAEKPLATTAIAAEKIVRMAKKNNIGLWLSNQRRLEPQHQILRERILNSDFGKPLHVTGYYVKGITHIGCTLIDTMRFILGEIAWVMAFPPFNSGSFGNDFSLRGVVGFCGGVTASIIGCDERKYKYSIFELDIICSNGRIRIEESGDFINSYAPKEYDYYPGFKELKLVDRIRTNMKWSMKYCLGALLKELQRGAVVNYLAQEGFYDLRVIEAFKRSAEKGGIKVAL